ncbi:MAG: FHA domain-containing protein [Anaerolineaceae bacterium]|nr:MAG: FHA domain-containing protein [Anaerolineaceae bacterium]
MGCVLNRAPFRKVTQQAGWFLLLLFAWLFFPRAVYSQGEIGYFDISGVKIDDFPLVQLQVAVRDPSGQSIDILTGTDFRVMEDGVELPVVSIEPRDVGVRVIFVVDTGDGVLHTGVSLSMVYEQAKEHIQTYVVGRPWMSAGVDEVAVVVQEGDDSNLLMPMGDDPRAVSDALTAYIPPSDINFSRAPEYGFFTKAALEFSLDELLYSPDDENKPKALVLFTPGARADLVEVAERAIDAGVPIHVVMARPEEIQYWDEALRPLASVTGGEFIALYEAGGLEPLFESIAAQRGEYIVTYRSTSASKQMRQVTLELNHGGQIYSAYSQYTVELDVPQVEITFPGAGDVFSREGLERQESAAEADPTFLVVEAQVTWKDMYSRRLGQARLLADGITVSQSQVDEGRTRLTWDIRSYHEEGQVPVELKVKVEDELGLQGTSPPITIAIEYIPPPLTSFKPSESILIYVSLSFAVVAVGLGVYLVLNRSRVMPVIQQAGENFVDFVERVTGRRTAMVARAYLVPLEGFDKLPSKPYEIYGTTAIGRSRRHADLLFHIGDEDSAISRLHCTILDEDDHFAIRDEDSTNGTLVNDEKLAPLESLMLQDGDVIDIAPLERGGLRFLFQLVGLDGEIPELEDDVRRTKPRRREA